MSQILSGLILSELQKINPEPFYLPQQKQLADAIAGSVQRYLNTSVTLTGTATVITSTGPAVGTITGKTLAP